MCCMLLVLNEISGLDAIVYGALLIFASAA